MATKTPLPLDFNKELAPVGVKGVMKSSEATSRDLWMVPVQYLQVMEGFNTRITESPDYQAKLDALKESIKENGFYPYKPLAGFTTKEKDAEGEERTFIYITDGHRRLAAARAAITEGADIEALPVVISPQGTSLEDLTVALVTANSGEPLSPMEVAIVCGRLIKFGWDDQKVARRLGITPKYVGDLLSLLGAPKTVRDMVIAGKVAASTAIATLKDHGTDAVKALKTGLETAQAAGKERMTSKHIEKRPKPDRKPKAAPVATTNDFLIAAIGYACEMSGDGLTWLRAWRKGDDLEVLAELEAHMGQPEGSTNDPSKRVPLVAPAVESAALDLPEDSDI